MNHTVFAVFCLMVCCKCMAMSADLAQIEQGISYKIEAMIRFDLDSKTQFNYREVRHDGNVYVRIANHPQKRISNRVQTTQEQRVYVHRSDGFTYVAAYDSSYPYLSTQRKVMQFRPLSFAVQLAFDLVNPNSSAINPDELDQIKARGIDQHMHFKADIRDPQHLTNLTMISASGFQVELIPTRFDQSIDLDDLQLFKVSTYCGHFRNPATARNITLGQLEHEWRVQLTSDNFEYTPAERRVCNGGIPPYSIFEINSI